MQGRLTLNASIPGDTAAEHADHAERHPERRDRAPAEPGRHGDRRQGRAERPGRRSGRTTAAGTCRPTARSAPTSTPATRRSGHPAGTSTTWTLPAINLPTEGDYSVTAIAYDTAGQQDTSTSGATSRYPIYPGDLPPTVLPDLMQPTAGCGVQRRQDRDQRPGRRRPSDRPGRRWPSSMPRAAT